MRTGPHVALTMTRHTRILVAVLLCASLAAIFAHTMDRPLSHDEPMYIAAGVLAQEHLIYRDFAYLQMPYLPSIYSLLYDVTGTTHYLLLARMLNFVFMAVATLLVYVICKRLSRSRGVAIGAVLIFLTNDAVLHIMPLVWNNSLPLALSLLAFFLFLSPRQPAHHVPARYFLVGLCAGIATGTKLTYIAMPPCFLLAALLHPRLLSAKVRVLQGALPLAVGTTIALLPVLYYFVHTGPEGFVFNNIGFHRVNAVYRATVGPDTTRMVTSMEPPTENLPASAFDERNELDRAVRYLPTLALGLAIGVVVYQLIRESPSLADVFRRLSRWPTLCAALLVLGNILVAIQPRPPNLAHFAPPIVFAIVCMTSIYATLSATGKRHVHVAIGILVLVAGTANGGQYVDSFPALWNKDQWTGSVVHCRAERIRSYIATSGEYCKLATLSPVYGVEAGLEIYHELATGPFVYRVGDLLSEEQRARFVATSPSALASLLREDPPCGILVGFEGELEIPFVEYAARHGYVRVDDGTLGGVLYVREDLVLR